MSFKSVGARGGALAGVRGKAAVRKLARADTMHKRRLVGGLFGKGKR